MPCALHYQLRDASQTPVPITRVLRTVTCASVMFPPAQVFEIPGFPIKEKVAQASSPSLWYPGRSGLRPMTLAPAPVSTIPRAVSRCLAILSPAEPSSRAAKSSSWTWGSAWRNSHGHRRTASRRRATTTLSRRPTAWPPDPAPESVAPRGEEPDVAGFPGPGRGSSCASRATPGRGALRTGRC